MGAGQAEKQHLSRSQVFAVEDFDGIHTVLEDVSSEFRRSWLYLGDVDTICV